MNFYIYRSLYSFQYIHNSASALFLKIRSPLWIADSAFQHLRPFSSSENLLNLIKPPIYYLKLGKRLHNGSLGIKSLHSMLTKKSVSKTELGFHLSSVFLLSTALIDYLGSQTFFNIFSLRKQSDKFPRLNSLPLPGVRKIGVLSLNFFLILKSKQALDTLDERINCPYVKVDLIERKIKAKKFAIAKYCTSISSVIFNSYVSWAHRKSSFNFMVSFLLGLTEFGFAVTENYYDGAFTFLCKKIHRIGLSLVELIQDIYVYSRIRLDRWISYKR